ncbi:sensor histidine kinase [Cesiribacter andamanensis]|nr:HAMP domain-containing sensor histidine kinase [Cesiribacter andamanensis]
MEILEIWKWASSSGLHEGLSTYEKGLVKLTNKTALLMLGIVNLLLLPIAVFGQMTAPILLINSAFYPLALYLNYKRQYQLSRHYLLGLLYSMLILVTLFRGLESGILFVTIPTLLLSFLFFQRKRAHYLHLGLLGLFLIFAFVYTSLSTPLAPYAPWAVRFFYPIHLIISLTLTIAFINFFLKVNRDYQRELQELNMTKNKLFSIIGHDLKGPLNSLNGVLGLLNNKYMSQEEFYQLSGKLQESTQSLHSTLNTLLQWSLTQMKGISAHPQALDVREVVQQLLPLYSETAQQKDIRLTVAIPDQRWGYVDPNHLALVLRNLIGNALKYTPAGGSIIISAEVVAKQLVLAVADTGIGLPEEGVAALFSPGINKSRKGTQGESGTGLGLLLCQEMVILNGGQLWATSTPGKGSTFYVGLPLANPQEESPRPVASTGMLAPAL